MRAFRKNGFNVKESAIYDWEECKEVNSKNDYRKAIISYTIVWIQYMEYLTKKYEMKMSEIWERCSDLADVDGIIGFMYGAAESIISQVWQYGEEFWKCYNSKWHYYGT